MNKVLAITCLLSLSSCLFADTVLDVSREWNAHISSSTVPLPKGTVPGEEKAAAAKSAPDTACACDVLKPQDYLEESTYAFTGMVDEATAVRKGKQTVLFDVDEIFKGSPKPEMKVAIEVKNDGCDLTYEKGQTYLVFAQWDWGTVSTHRCMGTKLLEKARKEALGPSEQLKEKLYIRLRNACMGRRDTACCLSSLKAMKVGYSIPEPEEGCPAGTLPDRLRCSGSYTWCIPSTEKRAQP